MWEEKNIMWEADLQWGVGRERMSPCEKAALVTFQIWIRLEERGKERSLPQSHSLHYPS